MHTNEKREDPLVELGYEIRDVDYPKTRKAIILFLMFGFGSAIVGSLIYTNRFTVFNVQEPKPGVNAVLPRHVPPAITPLLQDNVNSKTEIAAFRTAETRKLTATEYMDATHEVVRIPIARAMELIVQRGVKAPVQNMPVQPAATTSAGYPPHIGGFMPLESAPAQGNAITETPKPGAPTGQPGQPSSNPTTGTTSGTTPGRTPGAAPATTTGATTGQ